MATTNKWPHHNVCLNIMEVDNDGLGKITHPNCQRMRHKLLRKYHHQKHKCSIAGLSEVDGSSLALKLSVVWWPWLWLEGRLQKFETRVLHVKWGPQILELRHPGHKEITVTCSLAPILVFIDPILIAGIYYMKIRSRRWAWDSVATRWTCRTRRRTHDLPSFCVKWWVVELVVKNLGAFLFWRPCAIAHLAHARRRPCMIAYLCWTGLQIFSSENFTLMRPLRQKLSQLLEEAQKQTPYTGGNTIPVYKFTVHPLFYVYINENRGMPTIDSMSPWWGTLHYVPWQKGQNDHLLWGPWGWGQLKFLVDTKSSMRLAPMWEIIEPQDEKSNFASCSTTWWHSWNQLPNKIHAIVRT
jgi:hypothetical protein